MAVPAELLSLGAADVGDTLRLDGCQGQVALGLAWRLLRGACEPPED